MEVKRHMRDLGAHLTLSGSAVATTFSSRTSRAARALERARRLPLPLARKRRLTRGKAYAMGLYGVEATPFTTATAMTLRPKAADAVVGKHQIMRSPEAALSLAGPTGIEHDTG